VANQDPDRCLDLLRRHIRSHCPDEVEVVRGGSMPPSRTPIDHPAVPVVFEALKAVWGEEPVIVPLLGGGLPDHLFTGLLRLPSLWVPFAQPDQANHAPNENIMAGHFLKGVLVAEETLRRLSTVTL
jgi:acetylornithine deacetylase/succinyl-diaminopimelate desuccinylase-like protein